MKRCIVWFLVSAMTLLAGPGSVAQIRLEGCNQNMIHAELLSQRWNARWITVPSFGGGGYGVYLFRKTIDLEASPAAWVVNVSADNRYKLYVNGHYVACGPSRCDTFNWNFETVDLAPFLHEGRNVLAAVVWDYGPYRPTAQMSSGQYGFIMQGNTDREADVNTDSSWRCCRSGAWSPCLFPVPGYYVAGPGECFDASVYPWGWEQASFDDSDWEPAREGANGGPKGLRDYSGRLLVPDPIPGMELKTERLSRIRRSDMPVPAGFLQGRAALVVPPHTETEILLDNGVLTTAYFHLLFSGGRNSEIRIRYAESLCEQHEEAGKTLLVKGNRNDIDGKELLGYGDRILPDGGDERHYGTLWWRTYRYVSLRIRTAGEALTIRDLYGVFTAYPFVRESSFVASDHPELTDMLDIGWRTARLCANETYMDCPYYEQLQYFGDTRIQAMISLYNTRDVRLVRNALEQGRQSLSADGITMSRYPSSPHQFISSFSLWWIGMCHDYWMYRGDDSYVRTLLPAIRSILAWYGQWLLEDGSLGAVPYWFFADWADGFVYGEPARDAAGRSAFQDCVFLLALDQAAAMEQALGLPALAEHYGAVSARVRNGFVGKYWSEERRLFADTPDRTAFSQHVNALAVLAGLVRGAEAAELMKRVLTDPGLTRATIYFTYYVNLALKRAGCGDLLLDNTKVWRDQMALGLTTWAEQPEPSRSDCHAWGSSLNVELFRTVLGLEPSSPGFAAVSIEPSLGDITQVEGSIPHPSGTIRVRYAVRKRRLTATLSLPEGLTGEFVWKGVKYPLKPGEQCLSIKFE